MKLYAWRRATQVLLFVTPVFLLSNVALGNWLLALMLGAIWLLCLVAYVYARRQEHELLELSAYHDWLRWKAHQQ